MKKINDKLVCIQPSIILREKQYEKIEQYLALVGMTVDQFFTELTYQFDGYDEYIDDMIDSFLSGNKVIHHVEISRLSFKYLK
jgi:hypothetical protein